MLGSALGIRWLRFILARELHANTCSGDTWVFQIFLPIPQLFLGSDLHCQVAARRVRGYCLCIVEEVEDVEVGEQI